MNTDILPLCYLLLYLNNQDISISIILTRFQHHRLSKAEKKPHTPVQCPRFSATWAKSKSSRAGRITSPGRARWRVPLSLKDSGTWCLRSGQGLLRLKRYHSCYQEQRIFCHYIAELGHPQGLGNQCPQSLDYNRPLDNERSSAYYQDLLKGRSGRALEASGKDIPNRRCHRSLSTVSTVT